MSYIHIVPCTLQNVDRIYRGCKVYRANYLTSHNILKQFRDLNVTFSFIKRPREIIEHVRLTWLVCGLLTALKL